MVALFLLAFGAPVAVRWPLMFFPEHVHISFQPSSILIRRLVCAPCFTVKQKKEAHRDRESSSQSLSKCRAGPDLDSGFLFAQTFLPCSSRDPTQELTCVWEMS